MDVIKEKVEELRTVLEESAEYQNFLAARRQVEQIPGLAEKIREFCWRNYELQNIDGEDLYERLEAFEAQFESFRRDPVVAAYLERELRMCRMMQEIHARLIDIVEILI